MLAPYPSQTHRAADFAGLLARRHPNQQRLPICPASVALTGALESRAIRKWRGQYKAALQSRGGDGISPSSRTRSLLIDDCSSATRSKMQSWLQPRRNFLKNTSAFQQALNSK
jgi:hypothetical protein